MLLLSLHSLVQAQTRTVTGKVTDARGTGLPGVTVVVQGTTQGISTDAEGNYSVAAPDAATLVFSSIGYESKSLPVQGQSVLNVSLGESTQTLNEVVVTALNVARERKTLGYSVTEVSGASLTQAREINVTNSLVGKVAGLNVNSTAGGPGSSSNVIIRGVSSLGQTNQPLYVINGIPVEKPAQHQQQRRAVRQCPRPGRRHFQHQPRRHRDDFGAEGRRRFGPVRLPRQGRRYSDYDQECQRKRWYRAEQQLCSAGNL